MPFDRDAFDLFIEGLELDFFKPYEFLDKGDDHANPKKKGFGKNTDPPQALWRNMAKTAQVMDALRRELRAPIMFTSVYRSPAYNDAIGGEPNSQHMKFGAVDFVVRSTTTAPSDWAGLLRAMRQDGMFKGGIGTYRSFVHLDTRGRNVNFP